MTKTAIEYKP